MLSLPPTVRVFVAIEPVDMRGSLDSLAGAVRRLGLDPVDGHLGGGSRGEVSPYAP